MKLEDIKTIGVAGAGLMGHGIAISFALWGYPVILHDVSAEILKNALRNIRNALDTFVEEEVVTREHTDETIARISTTTELSELTENVDYLCESIPERAQDKRELFKLLDSVCSPHTILASNTSSLLISDFGSEAKRQDKLVITHYINPPHIVPCVEIVTGPGTSEDTIDLTYNLLEKARKLPVRVLKELPGFLVNRIQAAMQREIYDLWDRGIASTEDIDRAIKGSFGFRLSSTGPMLTQDLSGFYKKGPIMTQVQNQIFSSISNTKEIPEKLRAMWEAYQPFFEYSADEIDEITRKRDIELLRLLKQSYWSD